jgi:hypothetical protein
MSASAYFGAFHSRPRGLWTRQPARPAVVRTNARWLMLVMAFLRVMVESRQPAL